MDLVAAATAHRCQHILCCDGEGRPMGAVGLTAMIKMIVDRKDS